MKAGSAICVMLTASAAVGLVSAAVPQAPPASTSSNAAAAAAPAAQSAPAFVPGLDDLMTMIIQPRHTKLYYAGTRMNWALAAAQMSDLRSALTRVVTAIPKYQGSDVEEAIRTIMTPKLQAVDAAIAAANARQFVSTYKELTGACNACHFYLEHPYLVIKVPDDNPASAYPDQDFSTGP